MEGNFGKFGESSVIRQTKPSKLVLIINNLVADLLIHQIFFCQMLETSQSAKLPPHQTFPSYGISLWQNSIDLLTLLRFNLLKVF